jgi:hypothetical protein
MNAPTLTASGATELALIGFAGFPIQPFDIREIRYVAAEQRKFDREYSSRPQHNLLKNNSTIEALRQ